MKTKNNNSGLTKEEFHLVTDVLQYVIANYNEESNFEKFTTEIKEAINFKGLDSKWNVNSTLLVSKLQILNRKEILLLVVEVDTFLGRKESEYLVYGTSSPKQILKNY